MNSHDLPFTAEPIFFSPLTLSPFIHPINHHTDDDAQSFLATTRPRSSHPPPFPLNSSTDWPLFKKSGSAREFVGTANRRRQLGEDLQGNDHDKEEEVRTGASQQLDSTRLDTQDGPW